jgi:hypothetical protein
MPVRPRDPTPPFRNCRVRPHVYSDPPGRGNDEFASFLFLDGQTSLVVDTKPIRLGTEPYLKLSAFMYSLTNITSLSVPFILKDTLMLSPAQVGLFSALCTVPSFLKPVWTLVVRQEHRPAVLTTVGALQTVAHVAVGLAVLKGFATIPLVCGVMFIHSTATSAGMALRDSMMIESTSERKSDNEAHFFLSDVSMIQRVGLLPVSYLSGYLLHFMSPGSVIVGASVFPAVMTIAACFLDSPETCTETSLEQLQSALNQIQNKRNGLMSTVSGRRLLTTFVPSYADAMFYFYTTELGLSAEFLGRFQFLGSLAGLLGNLASRHSKDPRRLSNAANFALVPLYGSVILITAHFPLGPIPIGSFILFRHFIIDFLNALTTLPAAVQLMKSAPKGAQGTYLALTGTLSDLSNVTNSVFSSALLSLYGIDSSSFERISEFVALSVAGTAATLPYGLFFNSEEIQPRKSKTYIEELPEDDLQMLSPLRDA